MAAKHSCGMNPPPVTNLEARCSEPIIMTIEQGLGHPEGSHFAIMTCFAVHCPADDIATNH